MWLEVYKMPSLEFFIIFIIIEEFVGNKDDGFMHTEYIDNNII